MSGRLGVLFTALSIFLIPIASATPSGLTYLDSTWSSIDGEGGELIAMNPNRTILASYHGKQIMLFNTTTLEQIGSFTFQEDVSAMEFNPNGSLLAINKRSTVQLKESIRLIDIEEMEVLESSVQADDSFRNIAWSVDGKILASQGYDGDVEQYRIPSLTLKNTLHEVHVVDVTCIDYRSDGQYLLTGDESGRWAVWDIQGHRQGPYREYGQGLVDCKFTPDGSDLLLLGNDGNLTSREFVQSEKKSMTIDGAKEILFSKNGNRMHVAIESSEFKGLNTYDYETFDMIQNTTFFHRVEDIEILDDEFSRLQSLFVAAGTGEIAVYLPELFPQGYNSPGADLDGDNVPDDLDPDDDGDGLIDDWDDDFGCDAPEGTPCSRYPDLDKIRNIEISIGTEFVIRDQITLPAEDSSNIRNLSRNAIARDQIISATETQLFANSVCHNMDHGDIIDQLKESIEMSSGELGDAEVKCEVVNGMELVRDGDSTTQITIEITTTYQYSSMVSLPLDITLTEQTLPTDGSIAWLAPAHPISLTFKGDGVKTETIPLWWNDGETVASITINQVSVKNPTAFENLVDYALHPITYLLYLGIIIGILTLLIRKKNKIDFDFIDDEESEESTDDYTDEKDSSPDELQEDIDLNKYGNETDNPDKSQRKKVVRRERPAKDIAFTADSVPDKSLRRRNIGTAELNKSGPITKTKRKRLVSVSDNIDKKSIDVASSENKPKTRKVKVESVKIEQPIRKRKSVKKKLQNKGDKTIDEKELQDNLVRDFISED